MSPSLEIYYFDDKSIFLINGGGKLRRLYVPFKVQCILPVGSIKPETWVYVEQVAEHNQFRILYRVFNNWIPYSCFRLFIHY